jgi:hypothetical protein
MSTEQPSMLSERQLLDQVIRTFPTEFGLRAFPGRRFQIDTWSSFFSPHSGFQLVTQVWSEKQGRWLDFSRGSVEELRNECTNTTQHGD